MSAVAEDMDCTSTSSETNKETSEANDCETAVGSNETEVNITEIERPVVGKTDSHLVQIKASNAEILRRISAFTDQKRNEVDENNRQEFCGVFPSMEVSEDSCARTEAIFVPRAGGKSHIKVTRVVNSYGPQTRALGSGQEQSPSKPVVKEEVGPEGVEERLNNIETHLKMKGQSKADVFSRLKVLEERVLFLESLSPEYFKSGGWTLPAQLGQLKTGQDGKGLLQSHLWCPNDQPPPPKRQRSDGTAGTSRQSLKEMIVSEIEDKMKALRETLLKKAGTG